jgi:hypothetical protein
MAGPYRTGVPGTSVRSERTDGRRYDPAVPTRYRCDACGNLTRFDVTATRRTRSFHHYTVGGDLTVEGTEVLEELVEEVSCRWCGSPRAVRPLGPAVAAGETDPASPA